MHDPEDASVFDGHKKIHWTGTAVIASVIGHCWPLFIERSTRLPRRPRSSSILSPLLDDVRPAVG